MNVEFALIIYAAGVVNALGTLFCMTLAVSMVVAPMAVFLWIIEEKGDITIIPTCKRVAKIAATVGAVSALLNVLLPSERTMWLMAAGYAGQQVSTSQIAQETAVKLNAIIQGELDKMVKELAND